jgi:hypothetical protein
MQSIFCRQQNLNDKRLESTVLLNHAKGKGSEE